MAVTCIPVCLHTPDNSAQTLPQHFTDRVMPGTNIARLRQIAAAEATSAYRAHECLTYLTLRAQKGQGRITIKPSRHTHLTGLV